ncbi:hypothetical protein F66182_4834 [Fusarium sp. NRRL 66182]|nr:hypothetical protein F66182_4834 [Fusarium sp. NRRL 66182]
MSRTPPIPLPVYTAVDNQDLLRRIEAAAGVEFPISFSPEGPEGRRTDPIRLFQFQNRDTFLEASDVEANLVKAFFSAIEKGHDNLVSDFISRGWVSPETTSKWGESPLIAAVRAGRVPMVSHLIALGATVNTYGRLKTDADETRLKREDLAERTPLMVAAERGHLALVKVLMQDYGARDELIAPDGSMAIRLAAMNGHREIVDFLPKRRGGAWRRWKSAHRKQVDRMKKAGKGLYRAAKVLFWYCPKILLWEIPKILLYNIPKGLCKDIWKCRDEIKEFFCDMGAAIKKGVLGIPGSMARAGKEIWGAIKKIPLLIKSLAQEIWKLTQRIPGAALVFLKWIGQGLKNVGEAIVDISTKTLSLLHTTVMAVVSYFRKITLHDVWNGVCSLARAIFVDAPKKLGAFIVSFGKMSHDVLKKLFGWVGSCLWYIGGGIFWLIQYIPHKIWNIIAALGTSAVKAYRETMACINPKRMG